ncbi:MAG: hypothetical protein NT002_12440 [candidate division Zixibacteria bacterium]|nr:hypothetical protein [candidate division Zixibacteria bacterium]
MRTSILWDETLGLAVVIGIGVAGLFAEPAVAIYCDVYNQRATLGDCGSCNPHGHIGVLKTIWMGYLYDPATGKYYDCGPIHHYCIDCIDVIPVDPGE